MIPNGDTPEEVKNHPALKGMSIPKTGNLSEQGCCRESRREERRIEVIRGYTRP
jgi:hypothetical protein